MREAAGCAKSICITTIVAAAAASITMGTILEAFNTRGILARIPLFAECLDSRQLDHLASQCHPAVYPGGAVIMAEGDFGDAMYVIVDGAVSVSFRDRHGGERRVTDLKAGDIVGEMSLLTGMRRTAT
ncbi:MAG: cyclic nucleotide-binding domain-containing protein, partial [Hyphomicrobiales bacterium]|nr:cyclic nucleotide-binding domain-containing protein [Hyphomicrobiales bacterium]